MSDPSQRMLIYGGAALAAIAAMGISYYLWQSKSTSSPPTKKTEGGGNKPAPATPVYTFTSLEEAGYHFDAEQQLVKISDGSKFKWVDQQHYDRLGDLVVKYIQAEMLRLGLDEVPIPPADSKWTPQSYIYVSKDYLVNPKMMILLQGSGAVRPGVWGRQLCINDSLRTGSMLPYIERAIKEGYSLVILNPNQNTAVVGKEKFPVEGSESPEDHTSYVWDKFIAPSKAKDVVMVSHSYGGICTVSLFSNRPEAMQRIKAVAFTDSVHHMSPQAAAKVPNVIQYMMNHAQNWITSTRPLDEEVPDTENSSVKAVYCRCVSAGTKDHASTNNVPMDSVFKYFTEKLSHAE